MGLFGAAHRLGRGAGAKKPPPLNLSHIFYNDEVGAVIPYLKKTQKDMNHVIHPLSLLISGFIHRKSTNFAISRNSDINCIFIRNFYFFEHFLSL